MQTFIWHDGETIKGKDASQIVAALRADATYPEATFDEYLERLAFRAGEYTGKPHRSESAEALVTDLIDSGLLKRQ